MLESILTSNLGDDVYGDDETTKNLEILAAEILGFECGLLVPTGTFGNNVCVKSHTNHGEEIILPSGCH
jgi:threonine aldolase